MKIAILIAVLFLLLAVPFLLIWWKLADRWADEEHKRFKGKADTGPAPTVVRRSDVENDA